MDFREIPALTGQTGLARMPPRGKREATSSRAASYLAQRSECSRPMNVSTSAPICLLACLAASRHKSSRCPSLSTHGIIRTVTGGMVRVGCRGCVGAVPGPKTSLSENTFFEIVLYDHRRCLPQSECLGVIGILFWSLQRNAFMAEANLVRRPEFATENWWRFLTSIRRSKKNLSSRPSQISRRGGEDADCLPFDNAPYLCSQF